MKIGFIGAGNMARAIMGGMIQKGIYQPEDLIASRRNEEALAKLQEELGIMVTASNREVVEKADVIFLAVKPQMFAGVIEEIRPYIKEEQLFVSIAAGKTLAWIEKEFGKEIKLVRSMPNTPAMVGEGCTAYCGNKRVQEEDAAILEIRKVAEEGKNTKKQFAEEKTNLELVREIFDACGASYEVPESMMDVVGAAAGSSPAYVFMFMEAMADAAVAGGMPRKMAYEMVAQTVLGSAKLMKETGKHPGELKDMVCSPGGTTICGVRVLEEKGMRGAVMEALKSCIEKSKQL